MEGSLILQLLARLRKTATINKIETGLKKPGLPLPFALR